MQKTLTKLIRSALWRTGVGVWTATRYWRVQSTGPGYEVLLDQEADVFADLPTDFNNTAFSNFIARDSARWSRQRESVIAVADVLLEPERLLGTRAGRELVDQSVVYKHDRQYPYILPHLLHQNRPTQVLAEAIYYDGSATRNYYHHFVDALSRLYVLEKAGISDSLPLLITRQMFDQEFFQYLYRRSEQFRQLNWYVVEPGQWVQVQRLYFAQARHYDPATWQVMRKQYDLRDVRSQRRIFLNRDRHRYGRYLTNEAEAIALLNRYGFENTFAEHLTITEQAELFANTEYLIALTGAGLIQQFFMNPACGSVIEIMPANRLMPEYYWQGSTLGMRYYDVVVGGEMHDGKDYPVDLVELEAAVQRMLANEHAGRVYGRTALPALGVGYAS